MHLAERGVMSALRPAWLTHKLHAGTLQRGHGAFHLCRTGECATQIGAKEAPLAAELLARHDALASKAQQQAFRDAECLRGSVGVENVIVVRGGHGTPELRKVAHTLESACVR